MAKAAGREDSRKVARKEHCFITGLLPRDLYERVKGEEVMNLVHQLPSMITANRLMSGQMVLTGLTGLSSNFILLRRGILKLCEQTG